MTTLLLSRLQRFVLPSAVVALCSLQILSAQAQAEEVSEALYVSVPAQPLSEALVDLAAQLGVRIIAPTSVVEDLKSNELTGTYSADVALGTLLDGTNLVAEPSGENAYVVRRAARAVPSAREDAVEKPEIDRLPAMEVVIVRGERMERSVQDTASSVFAADEGFLDTTAFTSDVNDLLAFVPNVLPGIGQETPTIRGQNSSGVLTGSGAILSGTRARSTFVIDGRAIDLLELAYAPTSIWDTASVEIFRGPQTTTQGRNAIAGAIFINTNDPTKDLGGRVRVQAGNYDMQQVSGVINVPLVADEVALRVSGDKLEQGTFGRFVPQTVDDNDLGSREGSNLRAKLLIEPEALPGFRSVLTYNRIDTNGPQALNTLEDLRTNTNPNFVHWENVADIGIASFAYDLGNGFQASALVTGTSAELLRIADPGTGAIALDSDDFSTEVLLSYSGDGRLSGVGGVFYSNREESGFIDVGLDIEGETDSAAVFGELIYELTDRLSLTGGLRYQEDTQQRTTVGFGQTLLDFDVDYDALLPKASVAFDVNQDVTVGVLAARGYTPGGATLNFEIFIPDFFDEESLWNYEAFFRSRLAGGTVLLNANLFYTDYEDTQRLITFAVGGNPNLITSLIANAEQASSYGAEIEVQWMPNSQWSFLAGFGYVNTELEEYTELANTEFLIGNPVGNEFERAPNVSASLAATWTPNDSVTVDLRGRYTSEYFSDDLNTQSTEIDSLLLVDSRAAYRFDSVELYAFATNIFDEQQFIVSFGAGGGGQGLPNQPRSYGVGVDFRF